MGGILVNTNNNNNNKNNFLLEVDAFAT